jgi:hypothetical protein
MRAIEGFGNAIPTPKGALVNRTKHQGIKRVRFHLMPLISIEEIG